MTTTTSLQTSDPQAALEIFEVKPGLRFAKAVLKDLLPDVETALFFGKVYKLDATQLAALLLLVCDSTLAQALFGEGGLHSNTLQDYLIGGYYEHDEDCPSYDWEDRECTCTQTWVEGICSQAHLDEGDITLGAVVPKGEILPQVWESLEVQVAASIQAVAEKLHSVVDQLPGKQGQMVFRSMAVMNAKRPTIGDYRAGVHHAPQKQNLLVLDVSGSMSATTVQTIVDDVVALAYKANAHLAIVSDKATYWEPGTYGVDDVLNAATYGGTHYEQLAPLMDLEWGTVITVADYDSSMSAKQQLARCKGHIDEVLDVSLVNRPTFLAECVGQVADKVRPILIANTGYVLGSYGY